MFLEKVLICVQPPMLKLVLQADFNSTLLKDRLENEKIWANQDFGDAIQRDKVQNVTFIF